MGKNIIIKMGRKSGSFKHFLRRRLNFLFYRGACLLRRGFSSVKLGEAAGYSMIGILATASAGAVVALGLAQMQVNQMKTVRSIEAKYASLDWRSEIEAILRDNGSCKRTLAQTVGITPYRIGQGKRNLYYINGPGSKKYSWFSSRGSAQIYKMRIDLGSSPPSSGDTAAVHIEVFFKNNIKKDLMVKRGLRITRDNVKFNRAHSNKIIDCV